MQVLSGWVTDPSTPLARATSLNSVAPRRASLDTSRSSCELAPIDRTLSGGPWLDARSAGRQRHQAQAQRSSVNAAAAVAVRELEQQVQEPAGSSSSALQADDTLLAHLSQAQKDQLQQDRVRLELAWTRRRDEAEQLQEQEADQNAAPNAEEASPQHQRALLVSQWRKTSPVRPPQKRQNAASRSTSSRRARRRAQPALSSAVQRARVQQGLGMKPRNDRSSPAAALSPEEQLLERLRMQLAEAHRSGTQPVLGFLDSLGRTPVLTKQQEAGLTTIIRRGILLEQCRQSLQDKLGHAPSPTELQAATTCAPDEFAKATALASEGKRLMMRYNLRLVYSIAKQHLHRGLEMDDMLPEGVVGLEKAIDKFEPEKGFRFSTYSHWWIRQHIHRALVESRIIKLPVNVVDSISRISNARRRLSSQAGRSCKVTDEELASVLGLPVAKVKQLTQLAQPIKSLDMPMWHEDDAGETLHARISSDKATASEEDSLGAQGLDLVEDDMTALLQTLPVRERNVIRYRYGLFPDGKSLGLNEVGAAYGLTQERIRQIEESGLARLRERSPAHFKDWVAA